MGFVYMGSMWLGDTIVIEAFDMNFRSSLLFCLNAKSENKSITQKIFLRLLRKFHYGGSLTRIFKFLS